MANALASKLKMKEGQRALLINAPEGYTDMLNPLPDRVELTADGAEPEQPEEKAYDFVQLFAKSVEELERLASFALHAVKYDGLLWLCYPKGTSKIKTDINRDRGWSVVHAAGLEGVALVSVDETWSAMRFRPSELTKTPRRQRNTSGGEDAHEGESKNAGGSAMSGPRVVDVPEDLQTALTTHQAAAELFDSLSYSHKKEYVTWINDAKKAETRQSRIEKTVDKLSRGLNNPWAKG